MVCLDVYSSFFYGRYFFHRHSYFIKMAKEMEQGASTSSTGTIVSVGETSVGTEQAKPDIPIYQ